MLVRTWAELNYRLDVTRATKGSYFELDLSAHTLFELWTICKDCMFLFWLSGNKFLKIRVELSWTTGIRGVRP
jgi:hypothetical protein